MLDSMCLDKLCIGPKLNSNHFAADTTRHTSHIIIITSTSKPASWQVHKHFSTTVV